MQDIYKMETRPYALQENISPEERTVIKTIALIRMVGKQDEMYAKDEVIRLGAGMDSEVYAKTIEQLKQKQVVLFRSKLGSYAFKNNIGVDLEKEIERINKVTKSDVNKLIRKYLQMDKMSMGIIGPVNLKM